MFAKTIDLILDPIIDKNSSSPASHCNSSSVLSSCTTDSEVLISNVPTDDVICHQRLLHNLDVNQGVAEVPQPSSVAISSDQSGRMITCNGLQSISDINEDSKDDRCQIVDTFDGGVVLMTGEDITNTLDDNSKYQDIICTNNVIIDIIQQYVLTLTYTNIPSQA